MLAILETIGDFIAKIGAFVGSLFSSIVDFVTFCGKIYSTIENYFPYVPSWLLPFAVLFLSTGVLALITRR